jgi:hypothetical protein
MYEWLPWTNGGDEILAKIPTTINERRKWLSKRVKNRSNNIDSIKRISLVKWYGKDLAQKVKYIESFEVAEYGMQPSDKDIRSLFPMLKK